jgi:DNA-binding response OmpR family regulator
MRLLVVEDEPRIVEVLTSALAKAAFAVDAACSAAHAEEMLSSVVYDAAILDLGLPDGDGLGVIAAARAAGNATPILILTARDAVEDRVRGLDAGADDYLVKPFAMNELLARIRALLRRPGGALGTVLAAGNVTRFARGTKDVCLSPRSAKSNPSRPFAHSCVSSAAARGARDRLQCLCHIAVCCGPGPALARD